MRAINSLTFLLAVALAARVAPAAPSTAAASPAADRIAALLDAIRNGHESARQDACYALREMGADARPALPDLLAAAEERTWKYRGVAATAAVSIAPGDPAARAAVLEILDDPDPEVREGAVWPLQNLWPPAGWAAAALGKLAGDEQGSIGFAACDALRPMGPAAAPAVPGLLEAMKSGPNRVSAAGALGRIGPAAALAVPTLIAMLGDTKPGSAAAAALALGEIGPAAAAAEPKLAELVQSGPDDARPGAVFALGRLAPGHAVALPAPTTRPKDAANVVRAAHALGVAMSRGPTSHEAVLGLVEVLRAGEWGLAYGVAETVGEGLVPALVAVLDSPDPQVRQGAASILSHLAHHLPAVRNGPSAGAAARALGARLNDPEPGPRGMAAFALGELRSPDALGAELEAIKDPAWDVRANTALAMGGLRGDAKATPAAVAALTVALKDDNRLVRTMAARSLGAFGPAARGAVPLLAAALRDRDEREIPVPLPPRPLTEEEQAGMGMAREGMRQIHVRNSAVQSLGQIGPDAAAAVPDLVEHLKDPNWELRSYGFAALGRIGPGAAAAVPYLGERLKDPHDRYYAAEALARIGGPGIPVLIAALNDPAARYVAARELGRAGTAAVPALAAALSDPDSGVHLDAARALGANGSRARAAVPALRRATGDESRMVSAAAAEALHAIDPAQGPTEVYFPVSKGNPRLAPTAAFRLRL